MANTTTELVTIAMPVYNGAEFLAAALDSLLGQSYRDLRLIISDNASTDDTEKICKKYAKDDKRITYIRQSKNIGPFRNFTQLLTYAKDTEYFMWAAHDDVRGKDFVKACVVALRQNPSCIMAFPNIINIDVTGKIVRKYQSSKMFPKGTPASYIRLYCQDGKANLIYGLWRGESIRRVTMEDHWGSDMNLVCEQLFVGGFAEVKQQLFFKRLAAWEMQVPALPSNPLRRLRFAWHRRRDLARESKPYFSHLHRSNIQRAKSIRMKAANIASIEYARLRIFIMGRV